MNLLVTGASGFVGSCLIPVLASFRHDGIAVSRQNCRLREVGWRSERRQDILCCTQARNIDALLHLEVKQHVQNPSADDISEFTRINVKGTEEWLRWAASNDVKRFVFFSSIKASGHSWDCQDESLVAEPDTPYGRSKLQAELKVTEWAAASPERSALILRPAVVYGRGNQANILSLIEAIHRGRFFLVGRNENIKSMISLKNLTSAVNHLLSIPFSGTHMFYLTDKESFSVAQIAAMIAQSLGRSKQIRSMPLAAAKAGALAGDAFVRVTGRDFPLTSNRLRALLENTHFSCAKLQATGFVHPQTTREGLDEMVKWYLSTRNPSTVPSAS